MAHIVGLWLDWFIRAAVILLMMPTIAWAADAQDGPGNSSAWTTGAKQGVGTSATNQSKLWYTIGEGILHEIYFPLADTPNVQDLQFIVTDGATFVELERDTTTHAVELVDPQALVYRQINTAKSGRYRITKTYATDPARPTLLIETRFEALSGGPYQLYVLYNPSLNNSGMGDTGGVSDDAMVANDHGVASALVASTGFLERSNGYSGRQSDGLVDLMAHKKLTALFDSALAPGNVVQTARIQVAGDTNFTLALGFGGNPNEAVANAKASLGAGFSSVMNDYAKGWHDWLATLAPPPASVTSTGLRTQYDVALMVLKAHEDKTFGGANVASLTIPWGHAINADTCCPHGFGYHSVWPRDLYQVATALLAAGDKAAAGRSLDYMFKIQQRPDGSFPQNSRIDGSPTDFTNLQLDEVAFPIILAWQLGRTDAEAWSHVQRAADFIISHAKSNGGPKTPQERWEESSGFSPSTIAAEIAALVTAADLAKANGDLTREGSYLATADAWQRQVGNWTFTTTGPHGNKRYYERIDGEGDPNDADQIKIANEGGTFEERTIVDAGFLDLVRLGVKPAQDLSISDSLQEVDEVIRVKRPGSEPLFYRYNHDGYGEKDDGRPFDSGGGIGRLWPLLTGERGEYELARGGDASGHLMAMARTANDGLMIPEQVWDRENAFGFTFGKGTDSATPLAWSMAQFVRLALAIDAGRPVEMPAVVAQRYGATSGTAEFVVEVPTDTDATGKQVVLAGELNRLDPSLPEWNPGAMKMMKIDATHWRATVNAPAGAAIRYKYTLGEWAFVEKTGACADRDNRTVVISFGPGANHPIQDRVEHWRGLAPCGN